MFTVHYDVYKQYNVNLGGLTFSKIKILLAQPIPTFMLNCIRELCRPMVSADGFIFYPLYQSITVPALDPALIVRNGIPVGNPDAFLLARGFQFYPPLRTCLPNYYSGQTYVTNVSREGLEPCKITILAHWFNFDPNTVKRVGDLDFTYKNIDVLFDEDVEYNEEVFTAEFLQSNFTESCFITDLDVEIQSDSNRDAAARMLQHFRIFLPCDPFVLTNYGYSWLNYFPTIQLFGTDAYRGQILISLSQWQMEFVFPDRKSVV